MTARTEYLAKSESPAQIALLLAALPACFVAGGLCMLAVAALTQFRDPFDGDKFVVAGTAALLIGTTLLAAVASYMAGQFSRTGGTMIEATAAFAAPAPAAPDVFDRAASAARTTCRGAARLAAAAGTAIESAVIATMDFFHDFEPAPAWASLCRTCDRAYQSALSGIAALLTGPTSRSAGRIAFPLVSAALRHGPVACLWFAAWAASVAAVMGVVVAAALLVSQLPALSVPGPDSICWSLASALAFLVVGVAVGATMQAGRKAVWAAWELEQAALDAALLPAVVTAEPARETLATAVSVSADEMPLPVAMFEVVDEETGDVLAVFPDRGQPDWLLDLIAQQHRGISGRDALAVREVAA